MLGFRILSNSAIAVGKRNLSGKVCVVGSHEAFEDITKSSGKKILYFTASWCPPCKKIAPVFDKLSEANPEVQFVKVDIDDNAKAADAHGIRSVPTFQFLNGANKIDEFIGADEQMLSNKIGRLMKEADQ